MYRPIVMTLKKSADSCDSVPMLRSLIESLRRMRCVPRTRAYTSSTPMRMKNSGMEAWMIDNGARGTGGRV
jgi:hypothetical protein